MAAAGDVNGDGRDDVIVGAPEDAHNRRKDSGSAHVIHGDHVADPADVDLAALGARGMRIGGATAGDDALESVAAAGDSTATAVTT